MSRTTSATTDFALSMIKIAVAFGANQEWQRSKVDQLLDIERRRSVSIASINHGIEEMEERHKWRMQRIKLEEEMSTKEYKEFLVSIEKLKTQIVQIFPQMPEPMALLIYQHARNMLDRMWKQRDSGENYMWSAKLAEFFQLISDDSVARAGGAHLVVPEKTMKAITSYK